MQGDVRGQSARGLQVRTSPDSLPRICVACSAPTRSENNVAIQASSPRSPAGRGSLAGSMPVDLVHSAA